MIKLKYKGRLGNNIFQYSVARIISEGNGFAIRSDHRHRALPQVDGKKYKSPKQVLKGHKINIVGARRKKPRMIVLNGYFQRYGLYKLYRSRIIKWLKLPRKLDIRPVKGSIVLHYRCWDSERLQKGLPPCPFQYYKNVLDNESFTKVYIVTQHADRPGVQCIAKKWRATIISASPFRDFEFMRRADKLVMSVSTFSWWSAWLSDASTIYQPLFGYWDPQKPNNTDLLVTEPRYNRCSHNGDTWQSN